MEKNKNLVNFYKQKYNKKIKEKTESKKQYYANIYIQNKSEIDSILKIYNIKINNIANLITKNKADNINKILNIIRNKKFQEIKYSKLYE
jgi:prephenate dehydrogenase